MKKYTYSIVLAICLLPISACAASLTFSPLPPLAVGDVVPVTLTLSPQGESINALEGTIIASGAISLAGIREDASIVSLWVVRPTIAANRTASFSGVIPGGFTGVLSPFWEGARAGSVVTVLVQAREVGTGRLSLGPDTLVLPNDGQGTILPLEAQDLSVSVQQGIPSAMRDDVLDTEPPDPFTPIIGQERSVYRGASFLSFATVDRSTGVDRYLVAESDSQNPTIDAFVSAESPYKLTDQGLRSYIVVKAIDRAGNERIAVLPPTNTGTPYPWWAIGIALLVLAVLAFLGLRRTRYE